MRHALLMSHGSELYRLVVSGGEGCFYVKDEHGDEVELEIFRLAEGFCEVKTGDRRQLVHYAVRGDQVYLQLDGEVYAFTQERHEAARQQGAFNDDLRAPMPGQVTGVFVAVGDQVEPGQPLYGLEAMKMESLIKAPIAGVVAKVHAAAGEQVDGGALVVELDPLESGEDGDGESDGESDGEGDGEGAPGGAA
jgi:biotin carboxyl carrier protein